MRMGTLFLAAVLAVASLPARASEAVAPALPESVLVHLSIQSPDRLIAAVDDFATAVTEATRNQVEPGMITFVTQMYNPLPAELWDTERELHIALGADQPDRDVMALMPTSLPFADVLKAVEGFGFTMTAMPENDGFHLVTGPGAPPLALTDAGDNYVLVALSQDPAAWKTLLDDGWLPRHWGGGLVNASFNLPDGWADRLGVFEELERNIALAKEGKFPAASDDLNMDAQALAASMQLLEFTIPAMKREMNAVRFLAMEIDLNDERLVTATQMRADDGSLVAELAANAGGAGGTDTVLANGADADAIGMMVCADLMKLIPDLTERVDHLYSGMAGMFKGDLAPMQAAQRKFLASLRGGSVYALFREGNWVGYRFWAGSSDARALVAPYVDQLMEMNKVMTMYEMTYSASRETAADGLEYTRVDIHFPPETLTAGIPNLDDHPGLRDYLDDIMNNSILLAPARDDLVAGVYGKADETTLREVIAAADGVAAPWLASEPVQEALGFLPDRDIAYGLVDTDKLFSLTIGMTMGAVAAANPDGADAITQTAWDGIQNQFRAADGPLAFSLGRRGDRLASGFTMTTAAINAMLYNFTLFQDTLTALDYQQSRQNLEDDEEWLDDEDDAEDDELYDDDPEGDVDPEEFDEVDAA